MFLTSLGDAANDVAGAVRKAAAATGTGFDYLLKTAFRESGLNPSAKAPTSSAAGAFQFVEQTWLQVMKEEGSRFGLDAEAEQITRSRSGRFIVADAGERSKILALRHDPEVSALIAGAFTERNRQSLTSALGRRPDEGELYAAHFLGAQGAADLIRVTEANPQASAARAFPEAASANRSIFYEGGRSRSVSEVLANLKSKHDGGPVRMPDGASPATMVAAAHSAFAEEPRVVERGPVFHSMYRTGQRQPVNAYVERAWSGLVPDPQLARAQPVSAVSTVSAPSSPVPEPRPAKSVVGRPLDLSTFLKLAAAPSSRGRHSV